MRTRMAWLDRRRLSLLLPLVAALLPLALVPLPALAQINGLCDAVGYTVVGGAASAIPAGQVVQLGTATRWAVPADASVAVQQASSQASHHLDVEAVFYGVGLPIAHWHGNDVRGNSGPWKVARLAPVSRVIGVSAQSDACSGSVVLAVDESPFLTVFGALGILLAVGAAGLVGLLAVRSYAVARAIGGGPARGAVALGAGLGLVAGLGAGAFLQETEVLSPLDAWTLLLPLAGAAAGGGGVAAASLRGRSPSRSGDEQVRGRPTLAAFARLGSVPRAVAVGALAGLVVAAVPALAGLSAYRSSSLIDPARAADVVRIYWDANNRAVTSADPSLRAPYETGALRQATLHHLQALRALGVKLKPQALRALHVYVPQQGSYPGVFAASLETDQLSANNRVQHQTWYLLFTRQDAHSPWLAAMIAIAPAGNHLANFAADAQGHVPMWTAGSSKPVLSPARVSSAYASYIDEGLKSGQPSGPFASGPLTDQRVASLRSALQATASSLGVETSLDFQGTPQWYAFAGQGGSAVVFMNVADSFQVTSKPPHCLVQQRGGRFDPLLPDGKYRTVRQDSTDQFLAVDSPRSVDVIGSSIQTQQATGDLGTGCA
jgi:hypothetical protein